MVWQLRRPLLWQPFRYGVLSFSFRRCVHHIGQLRRSVRLCGGSSASPKPFHTGWLSLPQAALRLHGG